MAVLDPLKGYKFDSKENTVKAIAAECRRQGIGLDTQIAYVIATVEWETGNTFKPVKEAYWLSEDWRRRNLRYYPYYGRGFVQITWESNYKKYQDILGIPLVSQPDLALDEKTALYILVEGFKTGRFTGKKITDYITSSKTDYWNCRRCINGTDKAQTIADIAKKWESKIPATNNTTPSQPDKPAGGPVRKGNLSIRLSPDYDETTIKRDIVQSSELPAAEKFKMFKGGRLEINWVQEVDHHYYFELEQKRNGFFNWYAFDQHVDVYDDEKDAPLKDNQSDLVIIGENSVNIKVPYFSQRDNKVRPSQTCNMTCAAMVVEYFYPGTNGNTPGQLEDAMTNWCVSKWGHSSIYYHNRIVDTLRHWGVKSIFSTTTPYSKCKDHLLSGNPVIMSGKFTGSGHIIVWRGFDVAGYWVNDPWGEWFSTGYRATSGENLHYSFNMINRLSYGGSTHTWAHLCSKL